MNHLTSAWSRIADVADYGGGHQPPEDGDPLYALGEQFPEDVYDHPEYYTHGDASYDIPSIKVVRAVRGKPDAMVTIYRAAPEGVTTFDRGNWIALAKQYCVIHAMDPHDPAKDMPVYQATVPARTIRNGGNDLVEWGYWGPPVPAVKA